MKVAVGSKNPTKINAVKIAFETVFPDEEWIVEGVDVPSGVSDQPMSDRETVRGAKNRAKRSLKKIKADFGVGIEGGMQKVGKEWFTSGWAVVVNKEGVMGLGTSIRMIIPPKLLELILAGTELGHANDIVFKQTNSKHASGHFGIMTNDAISRTHAYRDGVFSALGRFLHPEVFE
jgi:inosine/xanthosine triphosphatase